LQPRFQQHRQRLQSPRPRLPMPAFFEITGPPCQAPTLLIRSTSQMHTSLTQEHHQLRRPPPTEVAWRKARFQLSGLAWDQRGNSRAMQRAHAAVNMPWNARRSMVHLLWDAEMTPFMSPPTINGSTKHVAPTACLPMTTHRCSYVTTHGAATLVTSHVNAPHSTGSLQDPGGALDAVPGAVGSPPPSATGPQPALITPPPLQRVNHGISQLHGLQSRSSIGLSSYGKALQHRRLYSPQRRLLTGKIRTPLFPRQAIVGFPWQCYWLALTWVIIRYYLWTSHHLREKPPPPIQQCTKHYSPNLRPFGLNKSSQLSYLSQLNHWLTWKPGLQTYGHDCITRRSFMQNNVDTCLQPSLGNPLWASHSCLDASRADPQPSHRHIRLLACLASTTPPPPPAWRTWIWRSSSATHHSLADT
jgi:hypothetical protein